MVPASMGARDRKSTRLNSSHVEFLYAVFCLKKKKNSVRYSRFSDTTLANVRTNWTTWSYGTLTDPPSSLAGTRAGRLVRCSNAPAQPRGLDRRVPQLRELVVQLEQRDREPRHLERCDVRADQVPGDLDAPSLQELVHLVVHDVELEKIGRASCRERV